MAQSGIGAVTSISSEDDEDVAIVSITAKRSADVSEDMARAKSPRSTRSTVRTQHARVDDVLVVEDDHQDQHHVQHQHDIPILQL
eukprot:631378-Amphidinium_carterae.1